MFNSDKHLNVGSELSTPAAEASLAQTQTYQQLQSELLAEGLLPADLSRNKQVMIERLMNLWQAESNLDVA